MADVFRNAWSRARCRLSVGGFAHYHRSVLDHRLSRVTSAEQAWGRHQVGNRTVVIGMRLEKFFDPSTVFRKLIPKSKKHFNLLTKLKANILSALAVGSLPQNSVALENNSIHCRFPGGIHLSKQLGHQHRVNFRLNMRKHLLCLEPTRTVPVNAEATPAHQISQVLVESRSGAVTILPFRF
jgi:hypothetical protein